MSFITLQSKRNDLSPQSLDSTYFRNDFKNGVLIKPGDTLSLVNLTINTAAEFIINDMNDTMVFRLGNRQTYTQYTAKLRHGAYDGPTAAKIIDIAMNDAIVGGIWKRKEEGGIQYGFNTTYDNTTTPTKPTFSINMLQQTASPTKNLSDKIGYKGIDTIISTGDAFNTQFNTTEVQPGGGDVVYEVEGFFNNTHMGSVDLDKKSFSAIDIGTRGVFLNGGSTQIVSNPVKGIDTTSAAAALSSFYNLYEGGAGGLSGDVWKAEAAGLPADWLIDNAGSAVSELNCNINATGASGAWDLTITFTNPVRKEVSSTATTTTFYLFSVSHLQPGSLNGMFVMGNDYTLNPLDPASANAPVAFWYYDNNDNCLVGSNSPTNPEGRINVGSDGSQTTHRIKCVDPANLISATLADCAGYCSTLVGICRQQFFYGDKEVADEAINTTPTGMDACIKLIKDDVSLIPRVQCCRIVAKAGKTFGASGWRDGNNSGAYTFPGGVGTNPLITNPAILGTNFTPGDSVRIGIEYTGLTSFHMFIEVAAAGTTTFLNRKNLVSVGRATTPAAAITQTNSPIKQSMWNIRPVSAYGGGGFYDPAKYTLSGIHDTQTYSDKSIYSVNLPAEAESLFDITSSTVINPPQTNLITPTTINLPAGSVMSLISELNRSSGTDASDVSQKIELPSQYTGYDITSISLYMNNTDPTNSFEILLDLYANITDPTATDIGTRFSGQSPFYTTFTTHIPANSSTAERIFNIPIDTSAYSTFYIVARDWNYNPTTNLGIKGDFSSNLTEGTTAGMLGGLKYEVKGNSLPVITLDTSTVVAVNPITTLSTLFKFGIVSSGDLNSDADIEPNVANCSDVIGMVNFLEATTLANTFPIVSSKNPVGSSTDLNMMVCLEDFNISGKNGGTGDDSKIICVVPKEQLTQSNTNVNIMHYTADFPIAIDLNPATEQTYYSLTASLRDMEGKFIRSLESPTHITLLHERDKKNAMAEAISSAIERENRRKANIQSNLITTAGLNNPRI